MAYSKTYFNNNPEAAAEPGVLYIVILVNKKTFERELLKIGITKGSSNRSALTRAVAFKGYDVRIQKLVYDTIENVYLKEQELHEKYQEYRKVPKVKFGGHTECFCPSILKEVLGDL